MEALTFEQLPNAVTLLTKEVSELKQLLINRSEQQSTQQPERLLSIQETGELLNLTVPTIYSKVSKGELPVMKRGKRLYFSRTELLDYLKAYKRKSSAEIGADIDHFQRNKNNIDNKNKFDKNSFQKFQISHYAFENQLQEVYRYLQYNIATASMVAKATSIPQKNICRYKRILEKSGNLWEVEKKPCEITGFTAWYLSTKTVCLPKSNQLSLF